MKMGIGDWGLGIGDWGMGPITNTQNPKHKTKTTIKNQKKKKNKKIKK